MHSRALLRTSFSSIRRVITAQRLTSPPISTQSNGSSPSSSSRSLCASTSNGENKWGSGAPNFESLLKSILAGAVLVGPSLGLCCYWSSGSISDSNSSLAFADSGEENSQPEKKPRFLFGDAYRRKVFFKYEKRIRLQSPPEKVFEYFASIRTLSGEALMTPADLMRAVVPVFPPSESNRVREGCLKGEWNPGELQCAPSEFFMLFDINNDGLISFAEYIFFVTILSIPESSFSVAFKMFDLDNNGNHHPWFSIFWCSVLYMQQLVVSREHVLQSSFGCCQSMLLSTINLHISCFPTLLKLFSRLSVLCGGHVVALMF